MTWWTTPECYWKWPVLHLPLKIRDLDITEMKVRCAKCGKNIQHMHGELVEYDACTELRVGVVCPDCKLVTYACMRVYPDGHILASTRDRGWLKMAVRRPWWAKVRRWLAHPVDKAHGLW